MNSYFGSKLNLLPNYFKKIGLGIVLIWALGLIFLKVFDINLSEKSILLLKQFFFSPLLVGLTLIGISKDKVEDELTIYIRLKAILWAFLFMSLFVAIIPFINLIEGREHEYKAEVIITMMIMGYLMMYYYQKRKR